MEPSFSFIVPFWGKDPHRVRAATFLMGHLHGFFPDAEICIGGRGTDSRAQSRNALARESSGKILAFIDADSIPDPEGLWEALTYVMTTKTWMLPYRTYYNLTEAGTKEFMHSPPWREWRPEWDYEHEYVFPGPDPFDRPAAVGGCVVVDREVFETIRGYDERFQGWGGEDRAFVMALETLSRGGLRYPGPIYHLWHPAPETERFNNLNWEANKKLLGRYERAQNNRWPMTALVSER